MLSPVLQNSLAATDFAQRYYQLCAEHPNRSADRCACAHSEVVACLADLGQIEKQRGPGRSYALRAQGLPDCIEFGFSIQGGGYYVEPYLGFTEGSLRSGSNYAVLAHAAVSSVGGHPPVPPYPRPYFYSVAELREAIAGCLELALRVGKEAREGQNG